MFSRYFAGDGDNIKYEDGLERFSWYIPTRISSHHFINILIRYHDSYLPASSKRERRIAGSKRVERYQLEHGDRKGSGKGWSLQSITANPALSTRSFEVCVFITY